MIEANDCLGNNFALKFWGQNRPKMDPKLGFLGISFFGFFV